MNDYRKVHDVFLGKLYFEQESKGEERVSLEALQFIQVYEVRSSSFLGSHT